MSSTAVALVSAPFYPPFSSCYQIELLSAHLERRSIPHTKHYLYYEFGREAALASQLGICKTLGSLRYFGDYLVLARARPAQE